MSPWACFASRRSRVSIETECSTYSHRGTKSFNPCTTERWFNFDSKLHFIFHLTRKISAFDETYTLRRPRSRSTPLRRSDGFNSFDVLAERVLRRSKSVLFARQSATVCISNCSFQRTFVITFHEYTTNRNCTTETSRTNRPTTRIRRWFALHRVPNFQFLWYTYIYILVHDSGDIDLRNGAKSVRSVAISLVFYWRRWVLRFFK